MNPRPQKKQPLDDQHEMLAEQIERLRGSLGARSAALVIREVLDELERYAGLQFGREEKLMRSGNYPQTETHTNMHRNFGENLEQLRSFTRSPAEWSSTLVDVLEDWLESHVDGEDRQLSDFLNARAWCDFNDE